MHYPGLRDTQHPEVNPAVAPRPTQRATYHCAAR
ncbi:hypothetical protein A2U01_0066113, partial [Trifolium medium]|nr:hypothetical protein [Trifolium medium]